VFPHGLRMMHARLVVVGLIACLLFPLAGCGMLEDPGTRLGYAIQRGADRLPAEEGASCTMHYRPPESLGKQGGSYTVQIDKVGALIVWYKDASGKVIDSGSTSHYSRFVDTPRTWKLDKPGTAVLDITLQREHGRAVIADVE
jgi:hypothetical protein